MEKFDIHILGCGSALPTTRHQATSQVLNIREKLFMIDCGEGAQVQLRRAKLKFSRLNHIFISHLHGDHCFGLMGLISTFGMLERTADLHIHAHADLQRLLEPQLEFFCKGMPYQVVFHPFNPVNVRSFTTTVPSAWKPFPCAIVCPPAVFSSARSRHPTTSGAT